MMEKGWKENDFLPQKWMFKDKSANSPTHLRIVSEEGIKFASLKSVFSFMRTVEKYSEKDVERFKLFPNGKLQHTKKEALYDADKSVEIKKEKIEENTEQSDEIAKPKKETGVRQFSPKQYAKILKMESNEKELQECKNFYFGKGWLEDDVLLPSLWMFRQKPGFTSFHFLSSKGDLLLSTKEANNYLAKLKVDHVIDAKKLKEKINNKHKEEMEITEEVKDEYYEYQHDVKKEESQNIKSGSIEMKDPENCNKIKEETVKLPPGITLKRVSVETKSKDIKQENRGKKTSW